jgi:glutamine synthetase
VDGEGRNIFDAGGPVSERLKQAVAGTLDSMADMQAVFAPHMNSYRRYLPASFAPTAPNWGLNNRDAGVRLPEIAGPAARLEHRICGADVNPYLALAAILAGMIDGIERELEPPLPLDDPDAETVAPLGHDWHDAVNRFENSAFARDLFGEKYHHVYTAVRRDEIMQLSKVLHPVEYSAYLSRL